MIPRTAMNKKDYDAMMKPQFYDDSLPDTPEEEKFYERHQLLANAIYGEIENHKLSTDDDIYVLFDCFGTKIVFLNFSNGYQETAESIAYRLLQQEQWNDFAVVLSPGEDEPMILNGIREAITKDGIFVQVDE